MKTGNKSQLIIFTRNPELGKVKSRLAKDVGEQGALDIYKILLDHTQTIAKKINVDKSVWYSEKIIPNDIWDTTVYKKHVQYGEDLGERMNAAFTKAFNNTYKKVVIIGSDVYDLKEEHLNQAFSALDHHDVVIGPAKDGGYYLLGMNILITSVFKNKQWGTDAVLRDTLDDLKNTKVKLLEELNDIDYIQDIEPYEKLKSFIINKNCCS